jgi:hypothetical protein
MRLLGARLLLTLGLPLAFTACATMGPPRPPSLELPKPPTDLRVARKGEKVILSWTRPTMTTDRRSVRGPVPVLICRTLEAAVTDCGTLVGHFTGGAILAESPAAQKKQAKSLEKKNRDNRITDSYTDVLSDQIIAAHQSGFMTYAVEPVNANGRGAGLSNRMRVPLAETLPAPQDFAATVTEQGVVLSWTASSLPPGLSGVHYIYRVYRRSQANPQLEIGELPAATDQRMTLIDSNIEWEQTYSYHAEGVTVLDQPETRIDGDDTAEVKAFTHDVFPPAVPSGLQAVFSGPGQAQFIDLIWAPVTDADLAGYNVYRHEAGGAPVRINTELVKVPAYRDAAISAGKTYFYSASAVDGRGNESARSAETSESAPSQ